jgi:uncharacterized protein (DUF433 family)
VLSFRVNEDALERLRRLARSIGHSPGEAAARLVEEGLRLREFPGIEFRDTPVGRQAYLRGTRLGVWQVVEVADAYAASAERLDATCDAAAEHLDIAPALVSLALAYASIHADEVRAAAADLRATNERLLTIHGR